MSGEKSAVGSAVATASAAPKLCAEAEALRARIAPFDADASRTMVGDLRLPESKDGVRTPQGPTVVFVAGRMTVDGQPARTPIDAAQLIQQHVAFSERVGPDRKPAALLAVAHDDADMARVHDVMLQLPDYAVYLVAMTPGATVEPVPKALETKLAGTDRSERARLLAEALQAAIADCKPVRDLFRSLATQAPDTKAPSLKNELPEAVHACDCKVGADLNDIAAYLLGADPPTVGKLVLPSDDAGAKTIALGGLTGQKLYDALPSDGSKVSFGR
jgi:hypothetical protein